MRRKIQYDLLGPGIMALLFLAGSLLLSGSGIARPLGEKQVQAAVETWVRYVTADARPDAFVERMEPCVRGHDTVSYIAHLNDRGFCLCGTDDLVLPVYFYSPDGAYDPQNPCCQDILAEIEMRTQYYRNALKNGDPVLEKYRELLDRRSRFWSDLMSGVAPNKAGTQGPRTAPDSMELNLTSTWAQGSPYNEYCPALPQGSDRHTLVGCPGTAISQITYYWKWPLTGTGTATTSYNYRWTADWVEEPLPSDPAIASDWGGGNRLRWLDGKLGMNEYWDGSVYAGAKNVRPIFVFAGTVGDGVYQSVDNGNNWDQKNNGLTNVYVGAIAINSVDDIYVGTGGGMNRSTDSSDTWTAINSGLTNNDVRALAINSSDYIFAGTNGGGIFRSTNDGSSWSPVNSGLTPTSVNALAINASDYIFAGTYGGGVYRSINHGSSWSQVTTGLTDPDVLALAINSSDHIFAGTQNGGMYRSTNSGASWTQINTGLSCLCVEALAINSSNYIFAGTYSGGVFRSTDNGDSWTQVNNGLTSSHIRCLAINCFDHVFCGTQNDGVFRTRYDGDIWEQIIDGLPDNSPVSALSVNCSYHKALKAVYDKLTQESDEYFVDFGAPAYQWDLMNDSCIDDDPPNDSAKEVARISFDVAVAIESGFGVWGSGTSGMLCGDLSCVIRGLKNHLRYEDDMLFSWTRDIYKMTEEIQWLRPIYITGGSIYGRGGHGMVVYGYNKRTDPDRQFLFNMGWAGDGNGWYSCDNVEFALGQTHLTQIAPISVRFVGAPDPGVGIPSDPYQNIEEALSVVDNGTTLIFKAGSDNTFAGSNLVITKSFLLKGKDAVIRKQ